MNTPNVPKGGRRHCFEFPGLRVGCAEYAAGPTGCTVARVPPGSLVTVDIRGGSPGVVMGLDGLVDAVCFAGGSLYGPEASAGVTDAVAAERSSGGRPTALGAIPVVRGAVIYDFRDRESGVAPDKALGAAAAASAAEGSFPLGPVGAGRAATVGKMGDGTAVVWEGGGQGAASAVVRVGDDLEVRVFVCAVVNAVGGIVDRRGNVVRGHLDVATGRRLRAADLLANGGPGPPAPGGSTTLSLVVLDAWVPDHYARQAARQIHTSMARALDPFHTEADGDVLFLVRYAGQYLDAKDWTPTSHGLGVAGSELMRDALPALPRGHEGGSGGSTTGWRTGRGDSRTARPFRPSSRCRTGRRR